jgi:hypothetical protein
MYAQRYHIKAHIGALYYQGDLAPRPLDLSFGPSNLCWGISAGVNITDWASLNARYMVGRLTGDDSYANDIKRKQRNLSFVSPLYEYGIYTDISINKLWKTLDKYNLRLYITAGINYIHFDPHAFYNGEWVRLQPLGTEGQNIVDSGKKPYSLYNWSRPIGMIVEFNFFKRLALGMEFSPRKTYTDYLDDVSGSYVNYDELMASNNSLGAALANRQGEYLGTGPVKVPTGTLRGRADKNDWYSHFGVFIKYQIGQIRYKRTFHTPDDSISKEEINEQF